MGNAQQAFSTANGNTRLSIATNPAPVPVYTRQSRWQYSSPNTDAMNAWENRTIWLNGLSVEITGEDVDGHGAIRVHIRWDEPVVDRDVRWTGRIVLDNDADDPWNRQSRIVVAPGRHIYLDRGLSPTQDEAFPDTETIFPFGASSVYPPGLDLQSGQLFTEPTVMTVKAGTKLHLRRNARLWVQNGSTLIVEPGAEVHLEPGAAILEGAGGGQLLIGGVVRKLGDIDGNGCVDRQDLRLMLAAIVSGGPSPFLDLDENGSVDLADAFVLVTHFTNRFGAPCP
jgi:hypothetical protein